MLNGKILGFHIITKQLEKYGFSVPSAIKQHPSDLGATNHYDQITAIDVVLSVVKNPAASGKFVSEVSCKTNAGTIHVKEEAGSMYESIDLLADKLSRQVKKLKDKSLDSQRESIRKEAYSEIEDEEEV